LKSCAVHHDIASFKVRLLPATILTKEGQMKAFASVAIAVVMLLVPALGFAKDGKTYKHAAEYQVATLDQTLRVNTGSDVTLAKSGTDAKLSSGGQGIHLLYTDQGNFRVEAPVNKGRTFGLAFATAMANSNRPAWAQQSSATIHNKWFLDNVRPGTKVMFAAECNKPNKKHPYDTVRCMFYIPDPDSTDHEYETTGDFTPILAGDSSNVQKAADTLCGKGKLSASVEAQMCPAPTPTPIAPPPQPADAVAPAPAASNK
jgi:hypothetical protein